MTKPHKLIIPEKNPKLDIKKKLIMEQCDKRYCGSRGELTGKDGYCTKYKMPYDKITFCVRLFKGGWLSPEGVFTASDFGSHDIDSEEILEKKFPVVYNHLQDKYQKKHKEGVFLNEYCKDKLVEKGWIDLTGNPYPMMGFTEHVWAVCLSEEKVTPQQHTVIKDFISKGMSFAGFAKINRRVVKE